MTLDEAIKHCLEKAEEKKKEADYFDVPYGMDTSERTSCLDCANDHLQLAEWLKELKEWRDLKLICGFDGYVVYKCKEADNEQ